MMSRTPPRRRARKEKFCKDFGRNFMLAAFEVGAERARAKKAQARAAIERAKQA